MRRHYKTIFLNLLFFYINTFPLSIIFVHTGPKIPEYFKDAYYQARLFNSDIPIYFIGDKEGIDNYDQAFWQDNNITLVFSENLNKSQAHQYFLDNYNPGEYKQGYWVKTAERFFYIQQCMEKYDLKNVFHLENDVMIYYDLLELFPIFERNYEGIAGTFDCANECIPGFMYIKNSNALREYNNFLSLISKGMHKELSIDMKAPCLFIKQFGRKLFDSLPVVTKEYVAQYGLRSKFGEVPSNPNIYMNHFDQFKSIFDGRALGMYIGGPDPSNSPLGPGYVFPCLFNSSYFSYEWIKDQYGRRIPYAVLDGIKYRINNLHFHCKKLHEFKS